MKNDILKLKEYMEHHLGRLDIDIANATSKTHDIPDPLYYEGAKSATKLFISLLDNIIKKNT